ncbi:hypothetical protein Tco_1535051, partial [Tanacetum coccineum]
TKACNDVGKARTETIPRKDYILLPIWPQDLKFSSSLKDSLDLEFKPLGEEEKKDVEDPGNKDSEVPSTEEPRVNQEKDDNVISTNNVNTARKVEAFVHPNYKTEKNVSEQTPEMLFSKEYKKIVGDGEERMKKTADSYTVTT